MIKHKADYFQRLIYLVRDWSFGYEIKFGKAELDAVVGADEELSDNAKKTLQNIEACFKGEQHVLKWYCNLTKSFQSWGVSCHLLQVKGL